MAREKKKEMVYKQIYDKGVFAKKNIREKQKAESSEL